MAWHDNALVRKAVVVWYCAPFGLIKFPVWLWRYATLGRRLQALKEAADRNSEDPGYGFAAGMVAGDLMCRVYAPSYVLRLAEENVRLDGDNVHGHPMDVGLYLQAKWIHLKE